MDRATSELGGSGVDPYIDAYEAAQERDGQADLADYLPDPEHPLYAAVLCELVRVDLEYGWMRGQPRALDDYRRAFPALFELPELARQVEYEERRLRRQAGAAATPGDDHGSSASLSCQRNGSSTSAPGSSGPADSDLLRTLHAADPGVAERVGQALGQFPEPGAELAGFTLLRELGRGAFGRVFLAHQRALAHRLVALKVSADPFHESHALAQLQHTNIVPIYSAHDVGPFRAVCMPYCGATTLADILRDLRMRQGMPDSGAAFVAALESSSFAGEPHAPKAPAPATAALQTLRGLGYVEAVLWIGARLADGLAHAHERGIIHRDLKPANVLLTDDGQPMLLDFNLAADTKRGLAAASASIGGTLPYMAPEALAALRGSDQPADERADIYSLGLILIELLTGRHPFPIRRGNVDEILPLMVADRLGRPPRVRPGNAAVSPAAESILLRCVDPDPARRYRCARELREDLDRQLEHRPLRYAPEPSPRERAAKWFRRHPRLSAAATIALIASVLLAGLAGAYARRERQFAPVEAASAFDRLAADHEAAWAVALDPALQHEAAAACRRALERYTVSSPAAWARAPLVRPLTLAQQAELRTRAAELLLLWSHSLRREAGGAGPAERTALLRTAAERNASAEAFYGTDAAPRALWLEREALRRLEGDEAGAAGAQRRAAATPVRSAREYALLLLDGNSDPGARAAAPVLTTAVEAAPRDFALWMALGQCEALRGRLAEADDCFSHAALLRPNSPWPYYHRGRVALERREYLQARDDSDEAIRLRPELAPACVHRALARLGLGDAPGAVADLSAALERGAVQTRVYFIRAEARARAGDAEGAQHDRAEGLRRTPVDVESWVARGLARLPGDPAGALADLDEVLRLEPSSRLALRNRAVVLSEYLGRPADAIAALDRAVALYPDDAGARIGRGVLLARAGRREAAHQDAEAARRRDGSGDTVYRVACIYALTAKTDPSDRGRALEALGAALALDPGWAKTARTDPDLDALRSGPELRALLRSAETPAAPRPAARKPRSAGKRGQTRHVVVKENNSSVCPVAHSAGRLLN